LQRAMNEGDVVVAVVKAVLAANEGKPRAKAPPPPAAGRPAARWSVVVDGKPVPYAQMSNLIVNEDWTGGKPQAVHFVEGKRHEVDFATMCVWIEQPDGTKACHDVKMVPDPSAPIGFCRAPDPPAPAAAAPLAIYD
jgi:hypothetical protein